MATPIKTLEELNTALAKWFEEKIPDNRLSNDTDGREWLLKTLEYNNTLKLEDLQKLTDREELNKEYVKRYKDTQTERKGISALKIEIAALYSFNKCIVQRHKGRLHYYRDDLSQKGARNMHAVAQAMALFTIFKKNLDVA
jgi:hypothetical protein